MSQIGVTVVTVVPVSLIKKIKKHQLYDGEVIYIGNEFYSTKHLMKKKKKRGRTEASLFL